MSRKRNGKHIGGLRAALSVWVAFALVVGLTPIAQVEAEESYAPAPAPEAVTTDGQSASGDTSAPMLASAVSLLATAANGGYLDKPVPYLDEAGRSLVHEGTFKVKAADMTWGADGVKTWYAIDGDAATAITLASRVIVRGDVHLILVDGTELTAAQGITVPTTASLTVFGQKGQTGRLSATTGNKIHAAIGGVGTETVGAITINGGIVNASNNASTDNYGGAAIGAAMTNAGGTGGKISRIAINGGAVTAKGYRDSVAIGSVAEAPDGEIVINGGAVVANGGGFGAGIGGAKQGYVGHIIVNGGVVTATSALQSTSYGAVGIGAVGYGYNVFGEIVINGGVVNATGACGTYQAGAGIGGGTRATGGSVTINGGTVNATSDGYVGIGGGADASVRVTGGKTTANATVADSGAVATLSGTGIQAGDITLSWTDETFATAELTASSYSTALTLEKPWVVKASNITATQSTAAGVTVVPSLAVSRDPVPYLDANGEQQSCTEYTNLSDALAEGYTLASGWYVVDRDITAAQRITCSGDVHLLLKDGLTLNSPAGGIEVDGSLTVYAQSAEDSSMGKLQAIGSSSLSGIGSSKGLASTIVINGGSVTASGRGGGAGIGGNQNCGSCKVVINGGIVEASASSGAGIGGGTSGDGGEIIITGGVVNASSVSGSGIGGAGTSAAGTLKLGWKSALTDSLEPTIIASGFNLSNLELIDGATFAKVDGVSYTEIDLALLNAISSSATIQPYYSSGTAVDYLDYNAATGRMEAAQCDVYTTVTSSSTALGAGWYVVDRDVSIADRIVCSGDVHLILMNGAKLTSGLGITVAGSDSLTVYSQTLGKSAMGQLVISDSVARYSAIGTDYARDTGSITINGGLLDVTSRQYNSVAIGGQNAVVTINNGYVTATSTGAGTSAAIGSGYSDESHVSKSIIINGGFVKAVSKQGAGIGGSGSNSTSPAGPGGEITISGGTVIAESQSGAGIGGGSPMFPDRSAIEVVGGRSGTIKITGGNVTATSVRGSGIGGALGSVVTPGGKVDSIEISGGTVSAKSTYGVAIGAGSGYGDYSDLADGGTISITGGVVSAQSGNGIGIGGKAGTGSFVLAWQGGSADSGKPRITANSYQIGALTLQDGNAFVQEGDDEFTVVTEDILNGYADTTTIVPFALESGDVAYLDYVDGATLTKHRRAGTYTTLTGESTALSEGWYAADADTAIASRVVCTGEVHLILRNDTVLTASAGITVKAPNALTVYQQPEEDGAVVGELLAGEDGSVADDDAGIGGSGTGDVGTIVIDGGDVTARAGMYAAGMGCGRSGNSGSITVNGGTVWAFGGKPDLASADGDSGSGIGLGHGFKNWCSLGSVVINGGEVHASGGGTRGAGIGGGYYKSDGSIVINGGVVDARATSTAAGIGGAVGSSYAITINGGDVTAVGGPQGAGIGDGYRYFRSTITITGGKVTATGGTGIGDGAYSWGTPAGKVLITGGEVTATGTRASGCGIGGDGFAATGSIEISGGTVTATGGSSGADIKAVSLYLTGDIAERSPSITAKSYEGTLSLGTTFVESMAQDVALTVEDIQSFTEMKTIFPMGVGVRYLEYDATTRTAQEKICNSYTVLDSDYLEACGYVLDAGWYVVQGTVSAAERIVCGEGVHIILADGCELRATLGVGVNEGSSLAVYAQSEDAAVMGKLTAVSAPVYSAGIGGTGNWSSNGDITINGGVVSATGNQASGIGGAMHGTSKNAITINGGYVTAVGTSHSAGIGAGNDVGHEGSIVINGGDVTAIGALEGAGIGSAGGNGNDATGRANSGTILITGGKVTAYCSGGTVGTGAGIGGGGFAVGKVGFGCDVTITGGDVTATGGVNGAGIGGGLNAAGSSVVITGGTVTATGNGSGVGIGGKNASVQLDWTKASFGSTAVTANSYGGAVTFVRPYVRSDTEAPAKWFSATDNNVSGVTIVPGVHFFERVPLKEGRWYDEGRFASAATPDPDPVISVSMPVNSVFTAQIDATAMMGMASELEFAERTVSDLHVAFTTTSAGSTVRYALPEGTTLTLTVISDDGSGGSAYEHYYAVVDQVPVAAGDASALSFSEFASMADRGRRFAPSASDRAYQLSIDFKPTGVAPVADVGMTFTADYVDSEGVAHKGALVSDEDAFSLVNIGAISATASTVAVTASPAGSLLLAGQRVYLVGEVDVSGADEGLNLQATAATYGTGAGAVAGTWISSNVVAFDLGAYGSDVRRAATAFSFAGDALASGTYPVKWALWADDAMDAATPVKTTWNVRNTLVSNEATSEYRPGTELPRLTATGPSRSRLYAASEVGAANPLAFAVTSNRPYRIAVEKQTALHEFERVSVGTEKPAATTPVTESVVVPAALGTYRVLFTMDGAESTSSRNDDVYYTVIVQ